MIFLPTPYLLTTGRIFHLRYLTSPQTKTLHPHHSALRSQLQQTQHPLHYILDQIDSPYNHYLLTAAARELHPPNHLLHGPVPTTQSAALLLVL